MKKTSKDLLEIGIRKRKAGDILGAIDHLNKSLKLDSSNSLTYFNLGFCKQIEGKYLEAIEAYDKAIAINESDASFYNNRACCLEELGNLDKALNDYSKALLLDPEEFTINLNCAEVKFKSGDYKGAIKDYSIYIDFDQVGVPKAFYKRGKAKKLIGDVYGAMKDWEMAVKYEVEDAKELLEEARECIAKIEKQKAKEQERQAKEEEAREVKEREIQAKEEERQAKEKRKKANESLSKLLPAGTYYIGDLSYIECKYNLDLVENRDGVFELENGNLYADLSTKYGDGIFKDCYGNRYGVDSGGIGCILIDDINEDLNNVWHNSSSFGVIATFPKPFNVNYDIDSGLIRFGSLFIDTGYKDNYYFYDPVNTYVVDDQLSTVYLETPIEVKADRGGQSSLKSMDYFAGSQEPEELVDGDEESYCQSVLEEKRIEDLILSANKNHDEEDYQGAISDYTKAIELDPRDAKKYFHRGMAKKLSEDYQGAIIDYTKAIEVDPKVSEFYFERGDVQYNLRNLQSSCKDWKKAAELGNEDAKELLEKYCTHI